MTCTNSWKCKPWLVASALCEPALDIDHTSASNSDQLVTHQAIGRFENLPRIPWSGLPADMILNLVNQGCRFTLQPEDFLILLPATEIVPTTGLRFFCGRATLFPQILIEQSAVIDPRPPNFTTGNDSGLRQPRVCVGMNVQKFSRLGERHGFTHGTLA
jgi:hypothetical protein